MNLVSISEIAPTIVFNSATPLPSVALTIGRSSRDGLDDRTCRANQHNSHRSIAHAPAPPTSIETPSQ